MELKMFDFVTVTGEPMARSSFPKNLLKILKRVQFLPELDRAEKPNKIVSEDSTGLIVGIHHWIDGNVTYIIKTKYGYSILKKDSLK